MSNFVVLLRADLLLSSSWSRRARRFPRTETQTMRSLKQLLFGGITRTPLAENRSLYPMTIQGRGGEQIDLSRYRGKAVLIVNTASKCGFTKQYDDLEALFKKYAEDGLTIIGFPSNDFASQEPGSDSDIESFCRVNHGVTFELFPKAPVTGDAIQPFFKALTTQGPSDLRGKVMWNFEKFLLDKEGRLVGRWRSWVKPSWSLFERAIRRVATGG